jgi:hypothetical protein
LFVAGAGLVRAESDPISDGLAVDRNNAVALGGAFDNYLLRRPDR